MMQIVSVKWLLCASNVFSVGTFGNRKNKLLQRGICFEGSDKGLQTSQDSY